MKIKVFPRRYCINTAIKKLLNDSMYHDIFSFTEDYLIDYLPNWVFNDTWETDIVTKEGAAVYIHKQLWYISPMFYEIVEE